MAQIPPGVAYIGYSLRSILAPFTFVAFLKLFAGHLLPTWAFVAAICLVVPSFVFSRILIKGLLQRREAAALGARFAPTLRGKWPGNVDVLVKMFDAYRTGYPGDYQVENIKECGTTFNMPLLWDDIIFTVDPQYIKIILSSDFPNYVKGDKFSDAVNSVLGTGVFNSDGEMWKFHRGMTRPFFTRDRISDFDNFDRHASTVINLMKSRFRQGYPVDFQDAISRFTLDSATEFLFGNDVCSLTAELPYPENSVHSQQQAPSHPAEEFARAFMKAQRTISERTYLSATWPLLEIFKSRTEEPMKVVNAYLEPIMKEAIEKHRKSEKEEEKITLLDHLVRETSDPVILKDEILNILIAGRDTTAATLTFIVYFLALYPDVLSRLRAEIMAHVGPARAPTYDNIRDMKYLRAVINETLRLYPAVPFDLRDNIKATTWPSTNPSEKPIYVPAGARLPYSVFLMHRRTDLWGPDAHEFDPDRFIDHRLKKYLTPNPFIFLPFNAGPRICLGQQFAYNEMSFMIIRLLQRFSSIGLAPDAQPAHTRPPPEWAGAPGRKGVERFFPKSHLTMYAHGGLWVTMGEAQEST